MVLIKKISTSSRNGDTCALLTLILKVLAEDDWSADTYLMPVIERLGTMDTAFVEAIKRLRIYSQMAEKNKVRNTAVKALFKLVEGYTHIPIAEMKEAALVVNNILKHYGLSIQHGDYAEESADIASLLNDLAKTDIVAAIAKLQGVSEIIAALSAAQKDFSDVALKQAELKSEKKDLASASQLKKESIVEINANLVGYMNTMAKVKPASYEATAKTIAELIDRNNELVKRRSKTGELETELASKLSD
ncbi:DUF6261 family protein [Ancylomarina sp.]|uniref:DUF6261 family protein n=1 Tax=Ancylomarina sp. TaxID=1970196 RepID=UPI0035625AC7